MPSPRPWKLMVSPGRPRKPRPESSLIGLKGVFQKYFTKAVRCYAPNASNATSRRYFGNLKGITMHSRTFLICVAASAAVGLGAIGSAQAADTAAVSQPVTFDIKPQPLASALNAFAVQSHQQILFTPEVAAGKTSPGIKGTSAPDVALARVLAGTGLVSSRSADGMILVSTADAKEASAKSDPPLAPNGATNN